MVQRTSFSSKYGRALEVEAILMKCENFNPTRVEDNLENFQELFKSLQDINNTETMYNQESTELTDARNSLFLKGEDSVMKLFFGIKTYVSWRYGKYSTEFKLLDSIWNRMVKSGTSTVTTNQVAANNENDAEVENKSRKDAEKTYASMSKNFADYVKTIGGFKDYNPDLEQFKLESLNSKLTTIENLNKDIAAKSLQLTLVKKERVKLYKDLKRRVKRIKLNIDTQYGADSELYFQISSLSF